MLISAAGAGILPPWPFQAIAAVSLNSLYWFWLQGWPRFRFAQPESLRFDDGRILCRSTLLLHLLGMGTLALLLLYIDLC